MNKVLGQDLFTSFRRQLVQNLSGVGLEIGFGSGLNLPYYSKDVRLLYILEPNLESVKLGRERIAGSDLSLQFVPLYSNGTIALPSQSVDFVVSSFTLCTIPNVEAAMSELKRVLKPGGEFRFLEHGLADEANVCRKQHRMNPIQKFIGGGCHITRKIDDIVKGGGFRVADLHKEYLEQMRLSGYLYQGVANR
ncbi:MAG: class I SAM-dependent methyltransferase [Oligoflexales bacterium]